MLNTSDLLDEFISKIILFFYKLNQTRKFQSNLQKCVDEPITCMLPIAFNIWLHPQSSIKGNAYRKL